MLTIGQENELTSTSLLGPETWGAVRVWIALTQSRIVSRSILFLLCPTVFSVLFTATDSQMFLTHTARFTHDRIEKTDLCMDSSWISLRRKTSSPKHFQWFNSIPFSIRVIPWSSIFQVDLRIGEFCQNFHVDTNWFQIFMSTQINFKLSCRHKLI